MKRTWMRLIRKILKNIHKFFDCEGKNNDHANDNSEERILSLEVHTKEKKK